jgi:DNA-binding CsgD family transcriptional regulator
LRPAEPQGAAGGAAERRHAPPCDALEATTCALVTAARDGLHSAFQAFGIAAAVLDVEGRLVAANAAWAGLGEAVSRDERGRVVVCDVEVDAQLREAVADVAREAGTGRRETLALPAASGREAMVFHIAAVEREPLEASDAGEVLVLGVRLAAPRACATCAHLVGLFGLTRSEARLCGELARGASLNRAADKTGLTLKTARTYLVRIFLKMDVHSQAQLVALILSAQLPQS